MRRIAIATLLFAALSSTAFAANIACPASVSAAKYDNVGPKSADAGVYKVDFNKGKELITSASVNVIANQTKPVNVSQEQAYLYSYKMDPKTGTVELIPAVHSDGESVLLNVQNPQSADATINYRLSLTELNTIKKIGGGPATIQVPIDKPESASCGSISLARGQAQTFAVGQYGLTATITRVD